MPAEPLRFVHAANLFLDRALRIPHAIPADVRDIVEDATLLAFQNLVQFCCAHHVDFLLLTGNAFLEADRSLAARVTLLRELQHLDEAGISTFVLPGDHDPPAAWRAIPGLPSSVTILDADDSEPITIEENGRILATIEATTGLCNENHNPDGPLRIGLRMGTQEWLKWQPESLHPGSATVGTNRQAMSDIGESSSSGIRGDIPGGPFDYLALGGDCDRTTLQTDFGLIHHPGSLQGQSPDDIGFCGATLLEWTGEQSLKHDTISAAAVRFERMSTGIARLSSAAEFKQTMLEQLALHPPVDGERVRFIYWRLTGTGRLLPLLQNANTLREFSRDIAAHIATVKALHLVIRFDGADLQQFNGNSSATNDAERLQPESSLLAAFRRELDMLSPSPLQDVNARVESLVPSETIAATRLRELASRVHRKNVMELAERLGAKRLKIAAAKGTHA